jgi:hypothetical protein
LEIVPLLKPQWLRFTGFASSQDSPSTNDNHGQGVEKKSPTFPPSFSDFNGLQAFTGNVTFL